MGLKFECPAELTCSAWALSYFADCLCDTSDVISFVLGVASIICWGLAEVPQIVTNMRSCTSSSENISLAFVFVWMAGDICNLAGCLLNPATLPTQFYLAVLYSATTIILVAQHIWSTCTAYRDSPRPPASQPLLEDRRSDARPPKYKNVKELLASDPTLSLVPSTQSLPMKSKRRPPLPVTASLPVQPQTSGIYVDYGHGRPDMESPEFHSGSWRRLTLSNSYGGSGSPVSRGLMFSSLVIVGVTLSNISPFDGGLNVIGYGDVQWVGGAKRQLLQSDEDDETRQLLERLGVSLGWIMMCIYLTGRVPQIFLNWSRDFVIGVSMPTIVFAFLGNMTYLASILVRRLEWNSIKFVLPWIGDVFGCLLMDTLMMGRYLYKIQGQGYTTLE